jgi:uncharacterized protein DUF4260
MDQPIQFVSDRESIVTAVRDDRDGAAPAAAARSMGIVKGSPRFILRIEGTALLAVSLFMYARYGQTWWLFALFVLAPDLGMLGYLADSRVGATTYNLFHSYLVPAVVLIVGVATKSPETYAVALIWFAHIGFDRALGYGLKYGDDFKHTHLGMIGRAEEPSASNV